jgi:hypothetical protein
MKTGEKYAHVGRLMLGLYRPPIKGNFPLPAGDENYENKEVAMLGQLPGVIKSIQ